MKRRSFLGASAGASAVVLLDRIPALAQQGSSKPNIVSIVVDDGDARAIDWAWKILGFMPKLQDQLVPHGVSFSRAFVSSPLCTPSRVSILTGRYPRNHGVVGNDYSVFYRDGGPDNGELNTVATALQAAGYRTVLLGKYMNGYPNAVYPEYVPPGWSEWYVPLVNATFFDYWLNANAVQVHYGTAEQDYVTDVIGRYAVDFILRAGQDSVPFFVQICPVAPHKPALAAPRHGSLFPKISVPVRDDGVVSYDEDDATFRYKPGYVRRKPRIDADSKKALDKLHRLRLQSLMAVDDLIGDLVEVLAKTGQLQRTFIFFSSDNGFQLGEHRLVEGKQVPYEESVRTPLMVRGPGVPEGATRSHLVTNVDFMPTWLELAGVTLPGSLDGRSIVPLLRAAPPTAWRKEVLVEFLTDGPEAPPFVTMRTDENWMYTEYDDGEREAYDMRTDPYQLMNLGATAGQSVPGSLSDRLHSLVQSATVKTHR